MAEVSVKDDKSVQVSDFISFFPIPCVTERLIFYSLSTRISGLIPRLMAIFLSSKCVLKNTGKVRKTKCLTT